jgi:hypothetical protein
MKANRILVAVKARSGSGILGKADYVLRVAADGGLFRPTHPKLRGQRYKSLCTER